MTQPHVQMLQLVSMSIFRTSPGVCTTGLVAGSLATVQRAGEEKGRAGATAFNIGGQRKVGRSFTCARDANKTLLIVYHFSLSFILPSSV